MTLQLHHIFVCTSPGAPEADALLDAGLIEGSPNIHPGQGTANRRFFFKNGFLELLWVHDKHEAQSAITSPTNLWDRWVNRDTGTNPFGLCFSSTKGVTSALSFATWEYRPPYLSDGRCFLFADKLPLSEPEVFLLNWPQAQSSPETEPSNHPLGLYDMRSVSVGLPEPASASDTLNNIRGAGLIKIHQSVAPELVIEFISEREVRHDVPSIGLTIVGLPG